MIFQCASHIHCQWARVIHCDNIVKHIPNIIFIYPRISSRRYSARHPTSEHRESLTRDIETQDVEILTQNSQHSWTSQHHSTTLRLETQGLNTQVLMLEAWLEVTMPCDNAFVENVVEQTKNVLGLFYSHRPF